MASGRHLIQRSLLIQNSQYTPSCCTASHFPCRSRITQHKSHIASTTVTLYHEQPLSVSEAGPCQVLRNNERVIEILTARRTENHGRNPSGDASTSTPGAGRHAHARGVRSDQELPCRIRYLLSSPATLVYDTLPLATTVNGTNAHVGGFFVHLVLKHAYARPASSTVTDGFVSSGPEHRDELPSPPLPRHACCAPLTWGDGRHPPTTTPNMRPVRAGKKSQSLFVIYSLKRIGQTSSRPPSLLTPANEVTQPPFLGPGMNTPPNVPGPALGRERERSCSLYRNITRMF